MLCHLFPPKFSNQTEARKSRLFCYLPYFLSFFPSVACSSMAPSMVTLTDRRRVISALGGGRALVDLDSVELRGENGCDWSGGKRVGVAGRNGQRSKPARQLSFKENINHIAAETYLITRLALTLLRYLGIGYLWISQFLALGCYAMLLMLGFVQVGYYYFFSKRVKRRIVYGNMPRNRMDLYLPADLHEPKPVLIFVTGGAWIIGYKAWGALLGLQLAERNIMVACIDYRNFPQGTISDMVKDVSHGIFSIVDTIADYGGDPKRIYLMGQSAGAHISACALMDQAIRESGKEDSVSWSVSQIKAYFGLSGGYNLLDLVCHFDQRGLYRSIFFSIMEGEESLEKFSPEVKANDPRNQDAIPLLPPIILFHGTGDYSIPYDASKKFADSLKNVGARAELILYEGKTHTDLFLQDPFRGGKDDLFDHVVSIIHSGDEEALAQDAVAPPRRRLCPEFLLKLATKISPF